MAVRSRQKRNDSKKLLPSDFSLEKGHGKIAIYGIFAIMAFLDISFFCDLKVTCVLSYLDGILDVLVIVIAYFGKEVFAQPETHKQFVSWKSVA